MDNISFVKSDMANERRIALLPSDLSKIEDPSRICVEEGYGEDIGFSDLEYEKKGAKIVSREFAFKQKVIVDPKVGDASYLEGLEDEKILIGYFHAVQNRKLTDLLLEKKFVCYAWEDLNVKGKNVFYRNNILAGEASSIHASMLWGRTWRNKKVAIFGRGNTAQGAARVIKSMGGTIQHFTESTLSVFKKEISSYDAFINAVLWDDNNDYYILSNSDLAYMKKHSLVVDISCDIDGAIEFSRPRTLDDPMVKVNDQFVYSLVNSPTLFPIEASSIFSKNITPYLNYFINKENKPKELKNSLIIDRGKIIDSKIVEIQKR